MLNELVNKNRSYRKFKADRPVSDEILNSLVELARITPSSKNLQPLKYLVLNQKKDTDFVFERLKWAWYLKDWNGPSIKERPPAYIIMLLDKNIHDNAMIDAGIASQTILLGAVEKCLGGCIIRTANRYEIHKHFNLPDNLEIILVIALGEPAQTVKLTKVDPSGNIEYFEDENQVHYVPKRSFAEIVINKPEINQTT
jgi:nitroreductase